MKKESVWIGLAHVKPVEGNNVFDNAIGAFVNILALSSDAISFKEQVLSSMVDLRLVLVELSEVDLLSNRIEKGELEDSIIQLGNQVANTGSIQFGIFHTYVSE